MQSSQAEWGAETMPGFGVVSLPLPQEEQARADWYALLARLWIAPPDADLLAGLAASGLLAPHESDQGLAISWERLVLAASVMETDAVAEEFDALFISVGTPKINP